MTAKGVTNVSEEVPVLQAPPIPHYPQFAETEIPTGSAAVRAFRGFIRPFSDDETARQVLRAICAEQPLNVVEGRLDSDAEGLPAQHLIEPLLINMAQPCTVVVLEFEGKEHPRAYLIDPPMVARLSTSMHVRRDKMMVVEGRKLPALCVYSGNLFKYDAAVDRLPQFLNQLATYLAKHIIFLRTRRLCRAGEDSKVRTISGRMPGEPARENILKVSKQYVWWGIWVGPSAPSGPASHLQTVGPADQCWCNSGELYGKCHLSKERRAYRAKSPIDGILTGL